MIAYLKYRILLLLPEKITWQIVDESFKNGTTPGLLQLIKLLIKHGVEKE